METQKNTLAELLRTNAKVVIKNPEYVTFDKLQLGDFYTEISQDDENNQVISEFSDIRIKVRGHKGYGYDIFSKKFRTFNHGAEIDVEKYVKLGNVFNFLVKRNPTGLSIHLHKLQVNVDFKNFLSKLFEGLKDERSKFRSGFYENSENKLAENPEQLHAEVDEPNEVVEVKKTKKAKGDKNNG